MTRRVLLVSLIALFVAAGAAYAQPPSSVSNGAVVTGTATIVAIDSTDRMISLKGENGTVETIFAGPDVKRSAELKVGDKVQVTYTQALAVSVEAPGAPKK